MTSDPLSTAASEPSNMATTDPLEPAAITALQEPAEIADDQEPVVFDVERFDAMVRSGNHIETPHGPLPIGHPDDLHAAVPSHQERLRHERDLLSAVLIGSDDNTPLWGLFRRRIGLLFHEAVPDTLWSCPAHRLIAAEIDAIVRRQRDVRIVNGEALRHGLRERALAGRWSGSLQELEIALAELQRWAEAASALDFPIACDLFQSAKARQLFYPALRRLLAREHSDLPIGPELQECRRAVNEAIALSDGRFRRLSPSASARGDSADCVLWASEPIAERPSPISTGIPSFDVDMRGGILPGKGDGTWVIAARSGIGKTTVAIATAMGLAINGADVLFFSCELSGPAILSRLLANYCRRCLAYPTPLYSTNDLEGRGKEISGEDLERLRQMQQRFHRGLGPDDRPMGELLYQSEFGATVEEVCAVVEDAKTANPSLSAVVLDHFHAMGPSPGYGSHTTPELAARAIALKSLAGRCQLDIFLVGQLNRGAYGTTTPDVSHLAGTSELERFASAVWLLERPKAGDGPPPPPGVLEVHHGKFRHGQLAGNDLSRTVIHLDRAHCFLEADEARLAFSGADLYPGVRVP
jgi:hypothetical protein